MHNNTDYTKDNLIKQCKDGQKLKQLIKQAREVKELIYQTEEVKDGNQIVSKIILDYIKNQENDDLKAKLINVCQEQE
ncbi:MULTISPECIES: hypothetical protein [spotted fever group]|uniref:Uncharacterized protein n=2 Tax=spotted fever group TaxID=114277 RepID=A0A510G7F2_9RICK|nr:MULTISPECIES: hypothetical protein [spotted fever group]MCZ6884658.1 ankyrin [Rickettsia endosymbiont of Ixodes ricinus]MCZ6896341.1 ankyrin [Rickettsia endosymbiont of Ixodes ricinus]BBJ31633.1 hypothetical protein RAS_07420 [Rickettsia asiatica]